MFGKIFLILFALLLAWGVWRNLTPPLIGIVDGRLHPCPNRPSCVSSYAEDNATRVDPFPLTDQGLAPLAKIIESHPRARIVKRTEDYLHAEFRSRFFSFVDDVEFLVSPDENVIHLRSAARVGYYDFGVNRSRIESLRKKILTMDRNRLE